METGVRHFSQHSDAYRPPAAPVCMHARAESGKPIK